VADVFYPDDLRILQGAYDRLRPTASQDSEGLACRLLANFRAGAVTEEELVGSMENGHP
jgi:hypothetical protein